MEKSIANSNRNVTGIGRGGTVVDGLKHSMPTGSEIDRNNQKHNRNTGAPPSLPHEITSIIPRLGDIFSSILEIKVMFNGTRQNPAIKPQQYKIIEDILEDLDSINMVIAEITTKLDDLSLRD